MFFTLIYFNIDLLDSLIFPLKPSLFQLDFENLKMCFGLRGRGRRGEVLVTMGYRGIPMVTTQANVVILFKANTAMMCNDWMKCTTHCWDRRCL